MQRRDLSKLTVIAAMQPAFRLSAIAKARSQKTPRLRAQSGHSVPILTISLVSKLLGKDACTFFAAPQTTCGLSEHSHSLAIMLVLAQ